MPPEKPTMKNVQFAFLLFHGPKIFGVRPGSAVLFSIEERTAVRTIGASNANAARLIPQKAVGLFDPEAILFSFGADSCQTIFHRPNWNGWKRMIGRCLVWRVPSLFFGMCVFAISNAGAGGRADSA
jgi:hypothetical protein